MRRMPIALLALAALVAAPNLLAQAPAPAFAIGGRLLGWTEASALYGGETYISVDSGRTRAVVTSIPRDKYGMDYSRASSYTVEVHNRVTSTPQVGDGDFYQPDSFPSGEAYMDVGTIKDQYRKDRYGSSSGEWIRTDATRTVVAYPKGSDGQPDKSQPYTRSDGGYFLHANNSAPFEKTVSAGCLIARQGCLDRIIATIKADRGRKRINVD